MGTRMACWFGFSAVSGAFGGLIAFGIQHANLPTISNWRLLFIVEGIPTVLLGILTLWFLPDRPEETRVLNEKERAIQRERGCRGVMPDVGRVVVKRKDFLIDSGFVPHWSRLFLSFLDHVYSAFKDWRIYVAGIIQFGANCSLVSISAFLPTIIKTFGVCEYRFSLRFPGSQRWMILFLYSADTQAQLLTVPPYAVLLIASYIWDHYQSRGISLSCAASLSGIGYLSAHPLLAMIWFVGLTNYL